MVAVPSPASPTVEAIYRAYETDAGDGWRAHLGASIIGDECERRLWYTFRWAARLRHTGRLLRLFETGRLEEDRLVENLRRIGVQVHQFDIETGEQFSVSACDGHFGGSMDAVVIGLPEAPKTGHVCEMKTHNAKSFRDLRAKGVQASKPMHYAQMQIYMHLGHLERAVYLAVCKDTDELHLERIHPDPAAAIRLIEKAERIVQAPRPPVGVSTDPSWWQCKLCPFSAVCHGEAWAPRHCRTCLHSSPVENGSWACRDGEGEGLGLETQRKGCPRHLYVPDLVPGEQVDASEEEHWVEYRLNSGEVWRDAGPAA